MRFAGIRPQPERCSNGSFRQGKTLRSMIETQGIKGILCKGELALGGDAVTTTVEGRERYTVNIRYPRDLRSNPQAIASDVLVPGPPCVRP